MRNIFKGRATLVTVIGAAVLMVVAGAGGAVAGGLITSAKIKNNTIQSIDVHDNALTGADVKNNSVGSADITDFGLSNQDIGVLFAQVNNDATIANSSGGVTASQPYGTGSFEVNFGRNVSKCAFTATVGDAEPGNTQGIVAVVTDRGLQPNAVFLRTTDLAGADADKPFQLIVVC